MCDKIFHAWLRGFARHFDAWFYLLYLHPIFTIEEFLDEKLIYGYLTKRQLCPPIIILIITSVSCVYAYFIESFCFYHPFSNTLFDIWVILLQDIGANERERYQRVGGEDLRKEAIIQAVVKGV